MSEGEQSSMSWREFIETCAAACADGLPEREFGKRFEGMIVQWSGTVEWMNRRKGSGVPGIRVTMPRVEVRLPSGRKFVGRSLGLGLTPGADMEKALTMQVGDAIVFRGEFSANGVFPNLTFTPDEEKNEVVLMTGLVRAKLV